MSCLYASDYGPADPGFDAGAGNGALMRGFEAHQALLSRAQNLGQLEAMKRKLAHGESVRWCQPGYGWTETPEMTAVFYGIFLMLILPWLVLRVLPRLGGRTLAARAAASARREAAP
jgi:hypothetical protein